MRERVLLASRDPAQQQDLQDQLGKAGYRVVHVDGLEEVSERLRREKISNLFLDLDGVTANDRFIRALTRQIPQLCIIVLSTRSHHPELRESMGGPICACIRKPLDPDEVLFCLESLCERRKER